MSDINFIKEQILSRVSIFDLAGSRNRTYCPEQTCSSEDCQLYDSNTYHCFKCKDTGDIFKWFSKMNNVSSSETFKQLANMAGVNFEPNKTRCFLLEHILNKSISYLNKNPDKLNYIVNTRKISLDVLKYHQVGYIDAGWDVLDSTELSDSILTELGFIYASVKGSINALGGRYIFPIRNQSGQLISLKGRANPDDIGLNVKKSMPLKADSSYGRHSHMDCLYLENLIANYGDTVWIAEGEPDTLTLREQGYQALGMMTNSGLAKHDRKLENFKTIILALDSDDSSRKVLPEEINKLAHKLPQTTIKFVDWPASLVKQDINSYHCDGGLIKDLDLKDGLEWLVDEWSKDFKTNSTKLYSLLKVVDKPNLVTRLSNNINISADFIKFAIGTAIA